MACMWPVDGVIGENGGFFFRREPVGHGLVRQFWHGAERGRIREPLVEIGADARAVTGAAYAEDQPFRLASIAFARPDDAEACAAIVAALKAEGADVTVNNLWVLGWLGGYDKRAMALRVLAEVY